MKYILILFLLFINDFKIPEYHEYVLEEISNETIHGILLEESYKYKEFLPVRPDVFTEWAYEVFYTESYARSNIKGGLNQMVPSTIKALNLKKPYHKQSVRYQVQSAFKFWIIGGQLKKCKSAIDLHILNMSPYDLTFNWQVNKYTKSNDINNDGYITPKDVKLYHIKKIKELK